MSTERKRFSSVELPGNPKRIMTLSMEEMNSTLRPTGKLVNMRQHHLNVFRIHSKILPGRIEQVTVADDDLKQVHQGCCGMPILTKHTLQVACIAWTAGVLPRRNST